MTSTERNDAVRASGARCLMPAVLLALVVVLVWGAANAEGHSGRRFRVAVVDGTLVAQGVITTGVDDGGGVVRPYANVLHDHWSNSPLFGVDSASSTLPGFDILAPTPSELRFHSLSLELTSVRKWRGPPLAPSDGDTPRLVPLDTTEDLAVTLNGETIKPSDGGSLLLAPSIGPDGVLDIDPLYSINRTPVDTLYVVQMILHTSAPRVRSSDPVHIVLSPDGDTPAERLHLASLFLEDWLASNPVPEPVLVGWAVLLGGPAMMVTRGRGRR